MIVSSIVEMRHDRHRRSVGPPALWLSVLLDPKATRGVTPWPASLTPPTLRRSGPRRLDLLYGRAHMAVGPVERIVGHPFPTGRAGREVGPSPILLVVHDGLRLPEALPAPPPPL